jgi:hypothetical protein
MSPDDQRTVFGLIDKLKDAAGEDRERASADLKTLVMMVAEPEIQYQAPMLIQVAGRTCRAYPI